MNIYIPEPHKIKIYGLSFLEKFLRDIAYRFIQGGLRYGSPNKGKLFLSRLKLELKNYEKLGNAEQLINIAVYCLLEIIAPENSKHHNNPYIDSVTRKEFE